MPRKWETYDFLEKGFQLLMTCAAACGAFVAWKYFVFEEDPRANWVLVSVLTLLVAWLLLLYGKRQVTMLRHMFSEDCFPSDQELADYYDTHSVVEDMAVATKNGTLKIKTSDGKWLVAGRELTVDILKARYAEAVADCKKAGFTDADWDAANQLADELLKETPDGN